MYIQAGVMYVTSLCVYRLNAATIVQSFIFELSHFAFHFTWSFVACWSFCQFLYYSSISHLKLVISESYFIQVVYCGLLVIVLS